MNLLPIVFICFFSSLTLSKFFMIDTKEGSKDWKLEAEEEAGQDYKNNGQGDVAERISALQREVDSMLNTSLTAETRLKKELVDIMNEDKPDEDEESDDTDDVLARLDRTIDHLQAENEKDNSTGDKHQGDLFHHSSIIATLEKGKVALTDLQDEIKDLRATKATLDSSDKKDEAFLAKVERLTKRRMKKIEKKEKKVIKDLGKFIKEKKEMDLGVFKLYSL